MLWHVLRAIALGAAALVIFVEEWGWRPLAALVARIAGWPPLARFEARIARVRPGLALTLFLVPAILLFPVKLGALWLIEQGRAALGITVIVVAKLIGTAIVGRLFILLEPKLMRFAWFARIVGWWRDTKERVMAMAKRSAVWRSVGAMRGRWRRWRLRRLGS